MPSAVPRAPPRGGGRARGPPPGSPGGLPPPPARPVWPALVGGACRLDVGVVVRLGADGTGEITVTATADADVIAQAPPGLAGDLRFDDAAAGGWVVDGPTPTEDGGLTITLRHPVASAEE